MKKILFTAAAAATALMSAPAFAAPIDIRAFVIGANVNAECSLDQPAAVNLGTLNIDQDPGPGALRLTGNNSETQRVWASCNYPTRIRVRSTLGGLRTAQINNGPDSADFTNVLFYRLRLEASDNNAFQPVELLTTGTPLQAATTNQTAAFHDRARLQVRLLRSDNPLRPLAGTYADIAIVTLGAI